MKITVEKARDGHSVPIVEEEGRTYHLGSMYDGRMFAKIWCDHHLDPNATVDLVLMGMGDMQIITEAESRLRGDIFVYEPCREIFNQMKTTPLFKKAQKQYHIHITTDFHEFSVWLTGLLNDDILDASVFFVHPGCYRVFWNEDVEKIHTMLTRAIGKLADFRDALSVVLDQVVMNELRNICSLKGGILLSRLFGRWSQDIPVIIVGAGPSLKKNINELKRVGNRACILAMDTALPLLVKEGIRPHMLASVDAGKPLIIFGDMKTLDMPILVTSNTVPELIRETPGKKIWCYEAHAFARYIREMIEEDSPTVPTDYGVSSLAVSFPVEMGTKKIIFVGMDMAFSPEGDSHAGVIHNDFIRDEEYILDGYYGDKVYSRNDWVDMKNWIEEIVDVVTYCTYINATEGGIRIKGTIQKPLKQVVDELKEPTADWMSVLDEPAVHISDEEYGRMMECFEKQLDSFTVFREKTCEDIFLKPGYERPPYFELFLCALRSRPQHTREERFVEAMEIMEGYINRIQKERETAG